MPTEITPSATVLLASFLGACFCAVYTWRRRAMPGGIDLSLMMAAVSFWSLCAAFEEMAPASGVNVFWSKMSYAGVTTVSPFWFLFAARYSHRDKWMRPWHHAFLWVVPSLVFAAAATNEMHGLVWPAIRPVESVLGSRLIYEHGPLVWVEVVYSYLLILSGTIFLARSIIRSPGLLKRQYGAVVGAMVAPWMGSIIYLSGLGPAWLDITPLAFTVTVALMVWGLVRYQILDVVPVAHDLLLSSMSDAVLVIDARGRIVNSNPAALRLFGTSIDSVGRDAAEALKRWPEIVERFGEAADGQFDIKVDGGQAARWIDTRISTITNPQGQLLGRLFLLRDVTERKRLEDELMQHATTDTLTGAFNRRMGLAILEKQLSLVRRAGYHLSVCFVDVDNLKKVNDLYGHMEGDRLIRDVAIALKDSLRELDSLCRLGGDEFLVIMPNCSAQQARAFIGRVEGRLKETGAQGRPYLCSASFGVAQNAPGAQLSADDLVARADEEMYKEKQRRKGRIPNQA